jgi:uncharacterized protein YbjT (DUF2867 family)
MVRVAIAGCSSGVGLNLLQAIAATGKHEIVVLSRQDTTPHTKLPGVNVRPVSYEDHTQLVDALKGVHTLICAIFVFSNDLATIQLALIKAAVEAGVKRFAPSEFAGTLKTAELVDAYHPKLRVAEGLRNSGLEYTYFRAGLFLNYFSRHSPSEEEGLASMRPWTFVVDINQGVANVPGDGNQKLTFTDVRDVAKWVASSLDLEKWDVESGIPGDTLTYREIVAIAEKVTGRKFLIKENQIEQLEEDSQDESKRFVSQMCLAITKGYLDIPPDLGVKVTGIKPTTVEEFIKRHWDEISLPEPAWPAEQKTWQPKDIR